jgi:hypothetical protein
MYVCISMYVSALFLVEGSAFTMLAVRAWSGESYNLLLAISRSAGVRTWNLC